MILAFNLLFLSMQLFAGQQLSTANNYIGYQTSLKLPSSLENDGLGKCKVIPSSPLIPDRKDPTLLLSCDNKINWGILFLFNTKNGFHFLEEIQLSPISSPKGTLEEKQASLIKEKILNHLKEDFKWKCEINTSEKSDYDDNYDCHSTNKAGKPLDFLLKMSKPSNYKHPSHAAFSYTARIIYLASK
jgi:hypothetical protein